MGKFEFDAESVGKVADMMNEKDLAEVEIVHDDYSIRLSKASAVAPVMASAPVAAPVAAAPAPVAAAAPAAEAAAPASMENHPGAVKSPMVGTAYLAANPDSPNFVKEGDAVTEGQTLLIVEAMKVMNQIPAPKSGTVKAVLVANAEPIEFGQPLVVIE
ncbi:acetyl-CoA carboxylase biotin carboxyl carrier protein [Curvivirga aplysinae]|uniref:acetyl-CoA carboxylase biotin carboxyl carrier protein n=1 Tax=Curvivirga aplysinae TaxID=2529852 RepID=UPI0012BBDC2A|nr:acetyl-CoA carboxylase biotin carboxyl carrier protein [Curvivirga aplysinae]MTI09208.1 acetyl-CoA carboxylase biotin carboxyl carrier protein [Curvivirga aplysinae]